MAFDADTSGPFRHGKRESVMREPDSATSVVRLFLCRGPTAVTRFVVAVVVDAVNGMFGRWPWSNVSEERLERIQPALAHGNPTGAVIVVILAGWLQASITDAGPTPVLGSEAMTV